MHANIVPPGPLTSDDGIVSFLGHTLAFNFPCNGELYITSSSSFFRFFAFGSIRSCLS